nr:capsid protein [Porcine circovirus 3]
MRHRAIFRRRPRPRRRRRHRRRYVRRKLFIRRPTAGTYYTKKYSTMNVISVGTPQDNKPWHANHFITRLNEWETAISFEYYKILKMKVTLSPVISPARQTKTMFGHTAIDLDGAWTTNTWLQDDPYAESSTRKVMTSKKKHSRYFTPKPILAGTTSAHPGQSLFFFSRPTPWLNTYDPTVQWGALLWSIYVPEKTGMTDFYGTKEVWIRYKSVL